MKIALLGAPNSGKTAVAKALSRKLQAANPGESWAVVDKYVEKLTAKTGRPFGVEADYTEHFAVVTARWVAEWEAESKGRNVITCGSIYESLIYAATLSFVPQSEADLLDFQLYSQASMNALGVFEFVTFEYDAMFYLPWQDPDEATVHSWDGVINAKIPEVLTGHGKYAVTLNGTDQERAAEAFNFVSRIAEATTLQQSGI